MPLVPVLPGLYPTAVARLLRGLALAGQARDADADTRGGLLAELDELTRWLAARAADAPGNFLHLLRLVEAERAWAAGDFRAAALAFDAARHEAAQRQRPWHRALIAEHAARFYLARGLEHAGHDLLAQARQEYLAWGATAKVAQLDWAYPARRPPSDPAATAGEQSGDLPHRRAAVTAGTVDLLGILSASQALSSETSIGRLHARVVQVLSAMTGATGVRLLLWDADRQDWLLPAPGGGTVPASDTGQEGAVPMSVLRYVQRTREPLVVGDATGDDRFARDPYFAGVTCCSLLAVPILSRGALRAVLLLENRLIRAAFTTGRLDAVNLIAGQLAVSLDNAQLYAEYRRIADEQAALRRVATLVARAAPPQEVFAAVAEEVGRLLAADFAILVRYDPADTLEVVGTWTSTGAPAPTPVGGRLPLGGRNVTTLVHQTGRPARIDYDRRHLGRDRPGRHRDWGLRSSVGVPVSVEGRLWGAMVGGVHPRGAAAAGGHRDAAGRVHRAGGDRDRQRRGAGRGDRLAGADRRRRRPGAPADRAGPARRRPAAAGLAGAEAARGAGRRCRPDSAANCARSDRIARGGRRAGGAAARSPAASTRRSWPSGLRPALRTLARRSAGPRRPAGTRRRAAARAGRGQRLLRRRRGADQRGQARPRLGRPASRSEVAGDACASRSATTAPAAPIRPAAPAWPA